MILPVLVLALPAAACTPLPDLPSPPDLRPVVHFESSGQGSARTSMSLEAVFRNGLSWEDFHAQAEARRELWDRNWEGAHVPDGLLERARATGGPWRVLAITDAACSDSVNTIPYLAKLAASLDDVELRLASPEAGRPWMEAHRSPDGRASTPTVLLLDADFELRGCWVEQPLGLQGFWLDVVARGTMAEEVDRKLAWYEEEAGRETLEEFVSVMEAARTSSPICPGL